MTRPNGTARALRTVCTIRFTALAIALAAIFGLTACDLGTVGMTSTAMANKYGCNDSVVVTGKPVTWIVEMDVTAPHEVRNTQGNKDSWLQLVRTRNHFGGADSTPLPSGTVVVIPRPCRPNEAPPSVTATVAITASAAG